MSEWIADRNYPRPIAHRRWCRNGQAPDGRFISQVGNSLLHCAAYRKKIIAEKVYGINNIPPGVGVTASLVYACTHIGHQTKQVCCLLNLAPADNILASDPIVQFYTIDGFAGGGADIQTYHYGAVDTGAVTPDKCAWGIALYSDVTPDADYRFAIRAGQYARILSFCIFEVRNPSIDDAAAGGIDPNVGVDHQIHDDRVGGYLKAATKLWRDSGQQQLNFLRDSPVLVPQFASPTWLNLADPAVGPGVGAGTPGVVLNNAYHNSRDQSEVPVVLAVHAKHTAGAGAVALNKARVWNGANGVEVGDIGGEGWYTATGTLPVGAGQKFDFQGRTNSSLDTVRFDAVCLWEQN